MKFARCKHLMSVLDPHVVCFVCRTNPQREIRKFHGCQSTFDGSIGDPTHCTICSTASTKERRDWFTLECISELFTTREDLHNSFSGYLLQWMQGLAK